MIFQEVNLFDYWGKQIMKTIVEFYILCEIEVNQKRVRLFKRNVIEDLEC